MVERKMTGITGIPTDPDCLGETLHVPVSIEPTEDPDDQGNFGLPGYEVVTKDETITELLRPDQAKKAGKLFARRMTGRDFKLFTYPNDTVNVAFIRNVLDTLEIAELWVPDVIVIDYADILMPEPDSPREFRHQQNKTWRALRALAQERHCFVCSATQADATSYDPNVNLGMSQFSEDKRKLSHVTAMLGLNQTQDEKNIGILRTNWIVLRKGRNTGRFCYLLQCLAKGAPLLGSYFLENRQNEAHHDE